MRILKALHLAVFSEKREKTISVITIAIIAQRLKILAEANAKVATGVCREAFHIGQHLVVTKGMLVGIARVEAVVDIREEKFEAVRLRLGQEAARNRAENTLADVAHRPMNHRCGLRNCFRSRRKTQTNCDG